MSYRWGTTSARLLLNWGVLVVVVAAVLVWRHRSEVEARAPLPPPVVHLSAAEARQWRSFPPYRMVLPVLAYHGVNSRHDALSVTPQRFAQQMLALRIAGFHAVTMGQYVSYAEGKRGGLPSRPILLTFDDGRLDTYRAVDNILRKYGFRATVFTFASWPTTNPGFSLTWAELRKMQQSRIWSVQEHGGSGHEYVVYNAAGSRGGAYAFRQYIRNRSGAGGHIESFPSFVRRATSGILWGEHQFASYIPGYRPLAFAVPKGNYGQQATNDPRIPRFMLSWLDRHFAVVFGGDYLGRGPGRPFATASRFSRPFSYRISVDSTTTLAALDCRLRDWVIRTPIWKEYRCSRAAPRSPATHEAHAAS